MTQLIDNVYNIYAQRSMSFALPLTFVADGASKTRAYTTSKSDFRSTIVTSNRTLSERTHSWELLFGWGLVSTSSRLCTGG